MGKKATLWDVPIKWAFGILIVIVILFVIFGPEQLLSKAKEAAFYFGIGLLPGQRETQYIGPPLVKEDVKNSFSKIVSIMEKPSSSDNCLVQINDKLDTKDFSIAFYNNKIQLEKKNDKGLEPPYEAETIKDFVPCIVNAENFYGAYLGKAENKQNFKDSKKYNENSFKIENSKITIGAKSYDFNKNYVFKSDSKICFFTVGHKSIWQSMKFWDDSCGFNEDGLYENCFTDINNKLPMCS